MSGAAITWTVIVVWVLAAPVVALAVGRMIALRDRQVPPGRDDARRARGS